MVLQGGPGVHGDGPELDLDIIAPLHADDQVQAPVSVGLGVADVVLLLDELDVVRREDIVANHVDVVQKGAHDAHADGVIDIGEGGLRRLRKALQAEFFPHALTVLDAAQAVLDGIDVLGAESGAQILDSFHQCAQDAL